MAREGTEAEDGADRRGPDDRPGSDRMGRLGIRGADSVQFGGLDGFGEAPDQGLEAGEGASLFDDHGIEFLGLALDVGEVGFEALEALFEFGRHGVKEGR